MMQTGARRLIAASIESMCVDSAGLPRNAARFAKRGMPCRTAWHAREMRRAARIHTPACVGGAQQAVGHTENG